MGNTDSDTNSDTDSDTDSENMDLETLEARLITEVIAALAAARANPRACAERIRKRSAHFHGKSFSPPPVNGEARPVKNTKEGVDAVPKKKAASKAPQSKPSFMGAVESLNSMAMGYGDLELMM